MDDILSEGNEKCIIPSQFEAEFAERSERAGGLLFSEKEIEEFNQIGTDCGVNQWDISQFEIAN